MRAVEVAGTFVDQVIGVDVPTKLVLPATGPVTASVGSTSVKLALVPEAGTEPSAVTRTRASAAPGPGTGPRKNASAQTHESTSV
jgi:hypothetical protein